jgi:hypothetical protein
MVARPMPTLKGIGPQYYSLLQVIKMRQLDHVCLFNTIGFECLNCIGNEENQSSDTESVCTSDGRSVRGPLKDSVSFGFEQVVLRIKVDQSTRNFTLGLSGLMPGLGGIPDAWLRLEHRRPMTTPRWSRDPGTERNAIKQCSCASNP